MSTEYGVHMHLDEITYSSHELSDLVKDINESLAIAMLSSLDLGLDDNNSNVEQPIYSLPKRLRDYRSMLLKPIQIQKLRDTTNLPKDFLLSIDKADCKVYQYRAKSVKINGHPRTATTREPKIGSSDFCIRKSGFRYVGTEIENKDDLVGTVGQFLVVSERELFVLVTLYRLSTHTASTLERVLINDESNIKAVIPAAAVGKYVVFAPWTDRDRVVDKNHLCVLHKSAASSYDN